MAARPAIVFVENKETGSLRPARYSAEFVGPEVYRQKVFRSVGDLEALDDQDLYDLARELNVAVTTKTDTAQLLWFQATRTQSIYLGPKEEDKENMATPRKKTATTPKKKAAAKESRGRPSELHGKKIYIKVQENPRRKGTHGYKSFEMMKNGMLVEDFIAAGGRMVDLRSDIAHKYVEVK